MEDRATEQEAPVGDDPCRESVATFSRLATRYAAKYFDLDLYDGYLRDFADRLAHGASVFDVACGPGTVSAFLAKTRPDLRLAGIDLAEGMIAEARLRVPSGLFCVEDCRDIGKRARLFDAAALAFGLSYLDDADVQRFFTSLNATVTDSAILYLATLTGDPAWSGFDTSSTGDRVYLVYRRPQAVLALVEQAGYRVEFIEEMASPANAPRQTQDLVLIARRGAV